MKSEPSKPEYVPIHCFRSESDMLCLAHDSNFYSFNKFNNTVYVFSPKDDFVNLLKDAVAIPSVSATRENRGDVMKMVNFTKDVRFCKLL